LKIQKYATGRYYGSHVIGFDRHIAPPTEDEYGIPEKVVEHRRFMQNAE
jgi:hypothetical protein